MIKINLNILPEDILNSNILNSLEYYNIYISDKNKDSPNNDIIKLIRMKFNKNKYIIQEFLIISEIYEDYIQIVIDE